MHKVVTGLFGIALVATSGSVFAAHRHDELSGNHAGFVAEFDGDFGGDKISSVSFVDGSTQRLDAGQGVTLAIGAHFRPSRWNIDFSGTVGYKYVSTKASNADIYIGRTVFQLMATYDPYRSWWIGAGPVMHVGTKLQGDGFIRDDKFDDAIGFTIQGGWKWVGIGYTNMEYKSQRSPAFKTYDASSIGINVRWKS